MQGVAPRERKKGRRKKKEGKEERISSEERREMMESNPECGSGQQLEQKAAILVGLEQQSSGGSDLWESVAAVPMEKDSDERYISFDEVQQQLMGLRYNSNIMRFLQEQMEKAQGLAALESLSEGATQLLDAALKQGHRLIEKHTQVFDVKRFYKIEDAMEAVRMVCGNIHAALVEQKSQIAFKAQQQCVDKDRQHLYAHLGYVLRCRQCDFAGEDSFQQEWESLRWRHEVRMRGLNVIVDSDLIVGRRRGAGGYSQVYEGQRRRTNTNRKATATPLWKAPELYEDENPSLESDVFSFGLIMYALVTRLVPYGFGTSELAVMRKKLRGEPPCFVGRGDCPEDMRDLMERCVAVDPGDRPTMSVVAECVSQMPRDWQPGQ
ncbi:unnamed protein product [Ostreobium quekettii]|uniref:Protein kinase domain-containing protein n=1 Tax=Ostreobium quekettii TaxID=121088 RepID=A0A8S1IPP0_9CHLO|nr:unnamed protein product [Ostreobium quekettii]|eukprot:evm.model.scf_286.5 EVM.evm.TU.scf_286.5   scf_286:48372-49907(+)